MATTAHPHEDYTNLRLRQPVISRRRLRSPVTPAPGLPAHHRRRGRPGSRPRLVDAVVPPQFGSHRTPEAMKEMLDQQTVNGTLRQWLDWWPPEVVAEILPDPADREQLASDMPSLPRAFYDYDVAVPPRWSEQTCGYVQLSAAYDADHAEAIARRWPTQRLASTHLATFTEPSEVLEAIRRVIDQITEYGARTSMPPDSAERHAVLG